MEPSVAATFMLFLTVLALFLAFYAIPDFGLLEEGKISSMTHRKLKEKLYDSETIMNQRYLSEMNVKDYHLIDPAPSSQTTKSGPIEHSAPIAPWIISWPPPPALMAPPQDGGWIEIP